MNKKLFKQLINSTAFHVVTVLVGGAVILLSIPKTLGEGSIPFITLSIILAIVMGRSIKFLSSKPENELEKGVEEGQQQEPPITLSRRDITDENIRKLYHDGYKSQAYQYFCKKPTYKNYPEKELKELFSRLVKHRLSDFVNLTLSKKKEGALILVFLFMFFYLTQCSRVTFYNSNKTEGRITTYDQRTSTIKHRNTGVRESTSLTLCYEYKVAGKLYSNCVYSPIKEIQIAKANRSLPVTVLYHKDHPGVSILEGELNYERGSFLIFLMPFFIILFLIFLTDIGDYLFKAKKSRLSGFVKAGFEPEIQDIVDLYKKGYKRLALNKFSKLDQNKELTKQQLIAKLERLVKY